MKLDKLTEATMLALRGKLNEVYTKQDVETFNELYDSCWGSAIEVLDKIAENNLEGELMNWLEDLYTEGEPIDITGLNDFIAFSAEDIYRALGLDENGDPLDESKKLGAGNKKYENRKQEARNYIEVKKYKFDGTDTFPKRIKARGGYTFTKVDDGKSENAFIPVYRNESGDETLMLQDDFDNCEILEARSHKEDNERVAPRTVKNAIGNDVKTREMVNVSNPSVGNKSYHNEKGNQYWGTTESEYASKRNKTGKKDEYGRDIYLAPFKNTGDWTMRADRMEPATATARYQYNKEQSEDAKERVDFYNKELSRVRSPYRKATVQSQIDSSEKAQKKYDDKAHQIYQDMKDKHSKKVTEATTDVNEVYDDYKKAYGKDLDLKTVPCVIARDKMLSGWGGAEGKIHYQVVLCADSTEAHNIGYKMQAEAKKEQLANVRVSFGVKIPRGGSVAYCVGRYATAWNMGDSWYERYDKKAENKKMENVRGKLIEDNIITSNNGYDLTGDANGYKVTKNGKFIKSFGRVNKETAIMEFDEFVANNEEANIKLMPDRYTAAIDIHINLDKITGDWVDGAKLVLKDLTVKLENDYPYGIPAKLDLEYKGKVVGYLECDALT